VLISRAVSPSAAVALLVLSGLSAAPVRGQKADAPPQPATPVCKEERIGVYAHPLLSLPARADWFEETGIDLTDPDFLLLEAMPTRVVNVDEYTDAMERRYPRLMQRLGPVEGTVALGLRIDAEGEVRESGVIQGSGREVLDELALELVEVVEWAPPTTPDGCRLEVWTSHPIRFGVRG